MSKSTRKRDFTFYPCENARKTLGDLYYGHSAQPTRFFRFDNVIGNRRVGCLIRSQIAKFDDWADPFQTAKPSV